MKLCYTLSKSANRLNINTFKRTLHPHPYVYENVFSPSSSISNPSPSISIASRLPWYIRFILWIKRNIFKISC